MGVVRDNEGRREVKEVVLVLLRESSRVPIDDQKQKIERYVNDSIGDVTMEYFVLPSFYYTDWNPLALYIASKKYGARRAVVYSWTLLASGCKALGEILSSLFSAGIIELHQAIDGDVITREEWDAHKEFMARFAMAKSRRVDVRILLEAVDYIPLTEDELRKIYNILAEREGSEKVRNRRSLVRDLAVAEIVRADLEGREPDPDALPSIDNLLDVYLDAYLRQKRRKNWRPKWARED